MTAKSYTLKYDGCWREPNIHGIPAESGVYTVYACRYNAVDKSVSISKLIYMGESSNVRDRIRDHEKRTAWRLHLCDGQQLCFNFAAINIDRNRVEAALINHHKPPENSEYVNRFPYPRTTVSTFGQRALLDAHLTVHTSPQRAFA